MGYLWFALGRGTARLRGLFLSSIAERNLFNSPLIEGGRAA